MSDSYFNFGGSGSYTSLLNQALNFSQQNPDVGSATSSGGYAPQAGISQNNSFSENLSNAANSLLYGISPAQAEAVNYNSGFNSSLFSPSQEAQAQSVYSSLPGGNPSPTPSIGSIFSPSQAVSNLFSGLSSSSANDFGRIILFAGIGIVVLMLFIIITGAFAEVK